MCQEKFSIIFGFSFHPSPKWCTPTSQNVGLAMAALAIRVFACNSYIKLLLDTNKWHRICVLCCAEWIDGEATGSDGEATRMWRKSQTSNKEKFRPENHNNATATVCCNIIGGRCRFYSWPTSSIFDSSESAFTWCRWVSLLI